VRRFEVGNTQVIYAGAPGGNTAAAAGVVLADAIQPVLAR
jgi:hypothetical protein